FWQYWNPIWGYALGRYVYAPLNRFMPPGVALILTFTVSGAIHDLVTMIVRRAPAFLFTPWFFLMSILDLIRQNRELYCSAQPFLYRVMINLSQIVGCFLLVFWLK